MSYQAEKQVVRDYYAALDSTSGSDMLNAVGQYVASDYLWRGYHPFGEMTSLADVIGQFWIPLKSSLTRLQRREDVFFAGKNVTDNNDGTWVVSMGHLMGLFDAPWLGIRPTRKMAFLRYAEFHRVEGGKICETAFYFDIPHLMIQAGQNPFPPQTGAHMVQPGPMPHDALLYDDAPVEEGQKTMAAIESMIGDLGQWQLGLPLAEELARTWHDDMIWWGPAGIGATYTIERYAKQHSGPFRAAFKERSKTNHIARVAEGHYGGFFGWPNFTARHAGGFMGMPGNSERLEFRVIDIYRRNEDKLIENWIFIDFLHVMHQQGLDVLGRMQGIEG